MTDTCPSRGYLQVGGRTVGLLHCDLPVGHDEQRAVIKGATLDELRVLVSQVMPDDVVLRHEPGTAHSVLLTWNDDEAIDWPEANDPDEAFDVPVGVDVPAELCGQTAYGLISPESCAYLPHTGPHSWE